MRETSGKPHLFLRDPSSKLWSSCGLMVHQHDTCFAMIQLAAEDCRVGTGSCLQGPKLYACHLYATGVSEDSVKSSNCHSLEVCATKVVKDKASRASAVAKEVSKEKVRCDRCSCNSVNADLSQQGSRPDQSPYTAVVRRCRRCRIGWRLRRSVMKFWTRPRQGLDVLVLRSVASSNRSSVLLPDCRHWCKRLVQRRVELRRSLWRPCERCEEVCLLVVLAGHAENMENVRCDCPVKSTWVLRGRSLRVYAEPC